MQPLNHGASLARDATSTRSTINRTIDCTFALQTLAHLSRLLTSQPPARTPHHHFEFYITFLSQAIAIQDGNGSNSVQRCWLSHVRRPFKNPKTTAREPVKFFNGWPTPRPSFGEQRRAQ